MPWNVSFEEKINKFLYFAALFFQDRIWGQIFTNILFKRIIEV